ncbi:MAG: bacillithiol biosynthesis cysteine-adding enzyme BshC [Candidatus Omnitrophica bacterium]|nr:bacillithiol biosynthesis cysteine-adding enzyme BshC [Candidatus Omnitrophota bacterium]
MIRSSLCVVTGQQPGLAGGPLYTFNKILSAVVFAKRLESEWDRPVIPILWDGGEDHDYEEINHLDWLSFQGGPVRFEIDRTVEGDRPAYTLPFDSSQLDFLIEFIGSVHPPTDYRQSLEEFLQEIQGQSKTWTDFFDILWLKIFSNHPLLVFRPWEPFAREMAHPIFAEEINRPEAFHSEIAETTQELEALDFKPQIHKKEGLCSFFYWDGVERRSVVHEEGTFHIQGTDQKFKKPDLLDELKNNPTAFSPSAVLRPLVQDAILPVAASVLGPSEIAYHAQIGGMYERHRIPRPFILPRFSLSLVFPKQVAHLEELGLAWTDLSRDEADLMKGIVQSEFLEQGLRAIENAKSAHTDTLIKLTELASQQSKGLIDPLNKQFGKVEKTLSQVEDLLRRDEMKRQENLRQRIVGLKEAFLPEGDLQERVYGILPFMARYGQEWIDPLVETADQWDGKRHYVYRLGG